MKAVMLSVQPRWCALIASGKKTVEVRKTKPKLDAPFKCYIYCTNAKTNGDFILCKSAENARLFGYNAVQGINKGFARAGDIRLKGKVIGEFICKWIDTIECSSGSHLYYSLNGSCLTTDDFISYCNGQDLYAWHISDLKIYDRPKYLCEFEHPPYLDCDTPCRLCKYGFVVYGAFGAEYDCDRKLKRPPQSWCYVEEV